ARCRPGRRPLLTPTSHTHIEPQGSRMAVETATSLQRAPRRRRIAAAATLAAASLASMLAPTAASAQSLRELYEAAHAYDATYLAARALAESATYRVEQTRALNRPTASLSGNAARVEST